MSIKGLLPKLDHCIFADVGFEPKRVYDHLEWCTRIAEENGIPMTILSGRLGGLKNDVLNNIARKDGGRFSSVPFFTIDEDGKVGMGRRQCTNDYKIRPIHKFLKEEVLGLRKGQWSPKEPVIEQWMGISYDEATRAKPSKVRWIEHVFPFLSWGCDYLDGRNWRRNQIIEWLEENFPDINVPRSACLCCPYHSNDEWRKIQENEDEWAEVVEFDKAIRHDKRERDGAVMRLPQFLHRSCKPLDEVDFRTDEEKGQSSLWDNECEGMCGM